MSDWISKLDPKSGRYYYINVRTRTTQWQKPTDFIEETPKTSAPPPLSTNPNPAPTIPPLLSANHQSTPPPKISPRSISPRAPPPLGGSFTPPPLLSGGNIHHTPSHPSAPPDVDCWYAIKHLQTGRIYYYQPSSRKTTWDKPTSPEFVYEGELAVSKLAEIKAQKKKSRPVSRSISAAVIHSAPMHSKSKSSSAAAQSGSLLGASNASTPKKHKNRKEVPGCPDWYETFDQKSNRVYFVNKKTKKSSWTKPIPNTHNSNFSASTSLGHSPGASHAKTPPKLTTRDRAGSRVYGSTATKRLSATEVSHTQLPPAVKDQIHRFKLEGYANKHFRKVKHGFFRRDVPAKKLLTWTNEILPQPILKLPTPQDSKAAITINKLILTFMGDNFKPVKGKKVDIGKKILQRGLGNPVLRDEIYIQVIKQVSDNPKEETSAVAGWQLMILCSHTFPPSKNFEKYMFAFLDETRKKSLNATIIAHINYLLRQMPVIIHDGPRQAIPTREFMKSAPDLPFLKPLFCIPFEQVMSYETADSKIPSIVLCLTSAIKKLGGLQCEGIFRVPGDIDEVDTLQLYCNLHHPSELPPKFDSVHAVSSLFKLWLRSLPDSLIPMSKYNECIEAVSDKARAASIVKSFEPARAETLRYILSFLKEAAQPENSNISRMGANNISMVFSQCLLRSATKEDISFGLLQKQEKEKYFIMNLMQNPAIV